MRDVGFAGPEQGPQYPITWTSIMEMKSLSNAQKMREMQLEINRLQSALSEKEKQLQAYRKRDKPMLRDFVKRR